MTNSNDINQIIKLYDYKIKKVIEGFFRSNNCVDDIKQEVLIKTWKNIEKQKKTNSRWSWIRTITVNSCKDYLRSKKNINLISEDEEIINNIPDNKSLCPEKTSNSAERQKLILKAIEKLNPKLKETLILHDIDELTCNEISQKLNCPIGTVKSRLFNARKLLRNELTDLLN